MKLLISILLILAYCSAKDLDKENIEWAKAYYNGYVNALYNENIIANCNYEFLNSTAITAMEKDVVQTHDEAIQLSIKKWCAKN